MVLGGPQPWASSKVGVSADILTAFGTLLLVTFLAVIIYNYRSTSRIVLMLCDDLMKKTTQTVINKTMSFLTGPADLTELSARLLGGGVLPFDNQVKLERLGMECVRSQPQIAMFLIGDRQGNFLLAKTEADGSIATKYINRQVKPPLTTWKYWDKVQQVIRTETNTTDLYDPRLRPWYQGAEAKKGISWTDLYIFYTGKKPGITVSYPILDSQGKVAGVIGCDIELVKLSHFLHSLQIGKNGLAFIMNEKQELVAYPDPAQLIVDPGETGLLRPYRVDAMDNPALVAAFQEYRKTGQAEFAFKTAWGTISGVFYRISPLFWETLESGGGCPRE